MKRGAACLTVLVSLLLAANSRANTLQLQGILFPDRRTISVPLLPNLGAPAARVSAAVTFRDGRAVIQLTYDGMKPAILYGGDVTSYVLWAVTRDEVAENLGPLPVGKGKGQEEYRTAKRSFALILTGEPFWGVSRPSELVVLSSGTPRQKDVAPMPFSFSDLAPAPAHTNRDVSSATLPGKLPPELLQARRIHGLAARFEAPVHAADLYQEADAALRSAESLAQRSARDSQILDAARRAMALDNEAIQLARRRREAIHLERQITARRAEMEELQRQAGQAQQQADQARRELGTLQADALALKHEKAALESEMTQMRSELFTMEESLQELHSEKRDLGVRLEEALSHVAETRQSARGFVVNLPDILFSVNAAALKPEAQRAIAKLAGILLVIPDLRVVIEGHTDSRGSADYNIKLSRRRAERVMGYLVEEGIAMERLGAFGFGLVRPVSDNESAQGRARNRRVEIIIIEEPEPGF
jgi:outer membrane protein OmpA-like peptidoglycan-associated protein